MPPIHDIKNNGVQHYLIESANEALKRGDKSAAKSCLLTARYLSVNDSSVTYEIYQMAKADGDVVEASKCFTNIFLDESTSIASVKSKKLISEETRLMINELSHKHLKMKCVLNLPPASIKSANLSTSVISSKRRSSSDTLVTNDFETEEQFYLQLYETLNDDIKKAVLSKTISECDSKLGQCRLMLLYLILFSSRENPDEHGMKLLEALLAMSQKPETNEDIGLASVMSIYYLRGLFISDALTLILENTPRDKIIERQDDIMIRIFSFYVEFCISSCSTENNFNKMLDLHIDPLSKQTILPNCDKTMEREMKIEAQFRLGLHSMATITGLKFISESKHDGLIDFTKRWMEISEFANKIMIDAAETLSDSQPTNIKHRGRFKKLATVNDDCQESNIQLSNTKQLFYSLIELMFLSISQYLRYTRSYILMEKISDRNIVPSNSPVNRAKRIKTENTDEQDLASESPKQPVEDSNLIQIDNDSMRLVDDRVKILFHTAVNCYEKLIFSKKLKVLWDQFHQSINLSECYGWQRRFLMDYLIYSGSYKQAMDIALIECKETNPYMGTIDNEAIKMRTNLQLITCSCMMSDKTKTIDRICSLMEDIKNFHSKASEQEQRYTNQIYKDEDGTISNESLNQSTRNLAYLSFDSLSCLAYCIDCILHILQQQTFSATKPPDSGVGHLIVLSQYQWPKECKLFKQCVYLIRKHKPKSATPQSVSPTTKFTYHSFFTYVYNPCIIEEFMALLQQGYTLDIRSAGHVQTGLSEPAQSYTTSSNSTMRRQASPTSSNNQSYTNTKAITTRGVNKSFKEDMKSALVCQMKKSTSSPNIILFIDFILNEVLPSLRDKPQSNSTRNNAKTGRR